MIKPDSDYLFEVSWEVCNKVGGIYTVINSKAQQTMSLYEKYFVIGPYFERNAKIDFMMLETPAEFRVPFEEMRKLGVDCYFGRWIEVKGKPFCILIDTKGLLQQKDSIKKKFWDDYKIDSIRGYWDFEEPSMWSYAVGLLLEQLKRHSLHDKRMVAHFHEWLSAFGLLHLKKYCPTIATVFTTHATVLGRTIAGNGLDLYEVMNYIDPTREAYNNSVEAKFLTEKAAATNADVFTTVSEITGIEAEHFLGRKPDFLLLNGLDIEKFPSIEDTSIKHITSRDKIREFLTYYFFPYYVFDVSHNLIFYTVGRYEFRNKGYDILIKALGKLNQMLKEHREKTTPAEDRTISVFFWIPMQNFGIRLEALENKNYYMHIKNHVMQNSSEILTRLIYDFISQRGDMNQSFLTETFMKDLKKDILAFERKGDPQLSTHNIDENNAVIKALKENGLLNRKEDVVKAIVMPVYLDGTDGFIDLNYYDSMAGCHLGLFPSYYEPWGYTPLESAALAVPSLTTDLSGFGMFLKNNYPGKQGIYVLERFHKNENDVVDNFAKIMFDFASLDHAERVDFKIAAKNLSAVADWDFLLDNYINAHNLALRRVNK